MSKTKTLIMGQNKKKITTTSIQRSRETFQMKPIYAAIKWRNTRNGLMALVTVMYDNWHSFGWENKTE